MSRLPFFICFGVQTLSFLHASCLFAQEEPTYPIPAEPYHVLVSLPSPAHYITGHFSLHDVNGDGVFSSSELQGVPDLVLGALAKSAHIRNALDSLLPVLDTLSDSKLGRLLLNNQVEVTEIFKRLFLADPKRAARLLLEVRETPFAHSMDVHPRTRARIGENADRIEALLSSSEKGELHALLGALDADYAALLAGEARPRAEQDISESIPKPAYTGAVPNLADQPDAEYVRQKEYLITDFAHARWLQTSNIGPCVSLLLYHPATQLGLLAHIDAGISVADSLDRFLQEFSMRGVQLDQLKAAIVGGWSGASERIIYELSRGLISSGVWITVQDVLDRPDAPPARALEVDLKDGAVYSYVENTPADQLPRGDLLQKRMGLGQSMIYRHPRSLSAGVSESQLGE